MKKHNAIYLLGGDITKAAQALGCNRTAIYKWETDQYGNLRSKQVVDSVLAACVYLYHSGKLPEFDEATLRDILTPAVGLEQDLQAA